MAVAAASARDRLVEVASRLFYAEGIHAVGVDRVIAEASVAKATLYAHFASKDELVAACLARQSMWWTAAAEFPGSGRAADQIVAHHRRCSRHLLRPHRSGRREP